MMTNLFETNENRNCIEGYVSGKENEQLPDMFPVERIIRVKVYNRLGKPYFRTRDVAALLGLKQQFQFTSDCKEFLGEHCILKGRDTEEFRSAEDSASVTFISATDLLDYLLNDSTHYRQKYIPGMYEKVVLGLQQMVRP